MFKTSILHNRTNLNSHPIYNSKRNGNGNELFIHILHENHLNGALTRNNEHLFPATSENNVPFHCPHRRDEYRNRYILICESRWRQTIEEWENPYQEWKIKMIYIILFAQIKKIRWRINYYQDVILQYITCVWFICVYLLGHLYVQNMPNFQLQFKLKDILFLAYKIFVYLVRLIKQINYRAMS